MLSNFSYSSAETKAKVYKLADSHGHYLEVKPIRGRFWRYRYEVANDGKRQEKFFSLGAYAVPPAAETNDAAKAGS